MNPNPLSVIRLIVPSAISKSLSNIVVHGARSMTRDCKPNRVRKFAGASHSRDTAKKVDDQLSRKTLSTMWVIADASANRRVNRVGHIIEPTR